MKTSAEVLVHTDHPDQRAALLASDLAVVLEATVTPYNESGGKGWVGFHVIDFNARMVDEILTQRGIKYEVAPDTAESDHWHGGAHGHGHESTGHWPHDDHTDGPADQIPDLEFVPNGALGAPDGEPSENARLTGAGNLLQSQ